MEKTSTESSLVVIQSVQSDGVFNARIILTETNYDVWSQIMEMHLAEREKLSCIRSSTKPSEESSKEYKKWYSENQKVKRWLLISMSPEIMKRYLRIPTAYEIWDALSIAFYDGSDELQVFTLNQKAFSTKQNGQPLSKFYGELIEIFREFDHRDKVVMKDPEDVVIYRKSVERLRVHIFLTGIDEEFDQVRGEILRKDIIPDLEECYSLIRTVDVRQSKLNKKGEYNGEEIHTLTYLPPKESQSFIEIINLQDTGKANGDDSQAEISENTFGEHNNSDTTAIENESHEEIPNQSSAEDVPTTSPIRRILPQRQNRGIPKPTYEPDFSNRVKYLMSHFVSNHRLSESNQSFVNQLSVVSIPNSVQETLKDPKWKAAMNDEMRSLQKNQTWELVDLPPGKKPMGCRWIYTIKYKADGSIERYKARIVAKGYTQTYGIDYTDTFAPVAKINTIRILLSLAVNLDWPVQQFDVKNAFLNGNLSEEIYMDLPPGCSGPERLNQKVCKLKKSLYGLKQSPRAWFGKFTNAMLQAALQKYLLREFEMKDLGALKYFLGIEVSRSNGGIFLSQRKYALDLLHEMGMTICQPIDTPIEEGLKFCITSDQVPVNKGRYQRLIRRLMYLSHTRPDLAYALSVVSQFMHNPGEQHMKAVMWILRHLKTNPGKGIIFSKNEDYSNIEVYTDADWAGSVSDRRSTSG
ncbi:hypothetical protein KPL71_001364 [Citrus sinensis]|uniref:Uncharacterized protein n=1 Tax=Citrus sinensis TaxID=2711 RepID=A0ACB8NW33_CITSI|nr:hypothetical protein KPL71_001364 [Citrus sinensis]